MNSQSVSCSVCLSAVFSTCVSSTRSLCYHAVCASAFVAADSVHGRRTNDFDSSNGTIDDRLASLTHAGLTSIRSRRRDRRYCIPIGNNSALFIRLKRKSWRTRTHSAKSERNTVVFLVYLDPSIHQHEWACNPYHNTLCIAYIRFVVYVTAVC